jgi:hypothetical protein
LVAVTDPLRVLTSCIYRTRGALQHVHDVLHGEPFGLSSGETAVVLADSGALEEQLQYVQRRSAGAIGQGFEGVGVVGAHHRVALSRLGIQMRRLSLMR